MVWFFDLVSRCKEHDIEQLMIDRSRSWRQESTGAAVNIAHAVGWLLCAKLLSEYLSSKIVSLVGWRDQLRSS